MAKRLDQVLGRNPFEVDESACLLAAQDLASYKNSAADRPFPNARPSTVALFKLFFVSICHQINWDFLLSRFESRFFSNEPRAMIEAVSNVNSVDIEEMLAGYSKPERIRAKERAKILRDVAATIEQEFGRDIERLFFPPKIDGPDGMLDRLAKFDVFSEDPLKKKANVFVQELLREHIASFMDEGEVEPAIDYHLIRLYIRTGRVSANDEIIKNLLISPSPTRMRVITLLRKKVSEALSLTAFYSGKSVFEINYVEWQIARQRCEYEGPICLGKWPDKEFDKAIIAIQPARCPYSTWCFAHNDLEWTQSKEPAVKKAFY